MQKNWGMGAAIETNLWKIGNGRNGGWRQHIFPKTGYEYFVGYAMVLCDPFAQLGVCGDSVLV